MLDKITVPVSPAPDLLTHNYAPKTVGEYQAIRETLSGVEASITQIDAELERLTALRKELRCFKDQHEGVVSTLRKLPNELLREIMKHCIPSFDDSSSKPAQHIAFELASVCTIWRATALSTPQLWVAIYWHPPVENLQAFKQMLSRSGDCYLEVHTSVFAPFLTQYRQECLAVIRAQFYRVGRCNDRENLLVNYLLIGPVFLRLRTLFIGKIFQCFLLIMFEHCPALEEVSFRLVDGDNTISIAKKCIIMHRLQVLSLYLPDHVDPAKLFSLLPAPNLSTINQSGRCWSTVHTPFDELFHRSGAALKKLKVTFGYIGNQSETEHLRNFYSHMEELHLKKADGGQEILDYMFARVGEPIVFPNLRKLTLSFTLLDRRKIDYLHDLMRSRSAEMPIQNIVLQFSESSAVKTLPVFDERGKHIPLRRWATEFGNKLEVRDRFWRVLDLNVEESDNGDVIRQYIV